MKKLLYAAMAAFATMFAASCEVDVDDEQDAEAMIATWSIQSEDFEGTLAITDKEFKINAFDYNGTYSYTYSAETFFLTGKGDEPMISFTADLIQSGTVLILEELVPEGADEQLSRYVEPIALYKKGAKIPCTKSDIQGEWRWASFHDDSDPRVIFKINGDNIEIHVPVWNTVYKGTYTYNNGYITMNVNMDQSSGHVNEDEKTKIFPFVVNGKKGYGIFANLPGLYKKQ